MNINHRRPSDRTAAQYKPLHGNAAADRLILTDADRRSAQLGHALARTSRWQGNAE